jgi:hypothetical protein
MAGTEGDDQYTAEITDSEILSDDSDDSEGALDYPPDRFQGVNQYGTTPQEERVDEPLDERISRDTPDPLDEIDEPTPEQLAALERESLEDAAATDLAIQDRGTGESSGDDDTALDDLDDEEPVGRLVEPGAEDDGVYFEDEEADLVAHSVGEQRDLSAEEAAVHLTGDPPMGDLAGGYDQQ